tara:strand:+ start:468 stop:731 length:264 start_codon:yes stop_codon:yes gene_type:complete
MSCKGSNKLADDIKIIPKTSLAPNCSLANKAAVIEPKIISVIISNPARPGLTYFGPHSDAKAPGITAIAINGISQGKKEKVFSMDGN